MRRRRPTRRSSKYRSGFEERVANYLISLGVAFSYETLKLGYVLEKTYTPDFILPNGVIVEVKGYWEGADRTKHLAVREANPEVDIRFCFQKASNTLSKRSKTTYAQWCEKHNFQWCEKTIPMNWLSG